MMRATLMMMDSIAKIADAVQPLVYTRNPLKYENNT